MLRKRTIFKPNLKQVAPQSAGSLPGQPPPSSASTTAQPDAESKDPIKAAEASTRVGAEAGNNLASQFAEPQANITPTPDANSSAEREPTAAVEKPSEDVTGSSSQESESCNITKDRTDAISVSQVSQRQVQEAIDQLTNQKFEPIKSLSLRTSANKNVKLRDLLFFNPPMTKEQKRHKKSVSLAKKRRLEEDQQRSSQSSGGSGSQAAGEETTSQNDNQNTDKQARDDQQQQRQKKEEDEDQNNFMPKVKMGPDGKLVLDESSTIINRKNSIKEQEAIVEDNEEIICKTNYESYRRKSAAASQTKWSLDDTKKFYHALSILGTDFSLMESLLFSGLRSRTELHKKFKREERLNKGKVDVALSSRITLNSEELEDLKEMFYK